MSFLRKLQVAHIPSLEETSEWVTCQEMPIELTCYTGKLKDRQKKKRFAGRRSSQYPRSQFGSYDRKATEIKKNISEDLDPFPQGLLRTLVPSLATRRNSHACDDAFTGQWDRLQLIGFPNVSSCEINNCHTLQWGMSVHSLSPPGRANWL